MRKPIRRLSLCGCVLVLSWIGPGRPCVCAADDLSDAVEAGGAVADVSPEMPIPQTRRRGGRDGRVFKAELRPHWFDGGSRFWYRNDLPDDRREFILVNADRAERRPAFDHARLAGGLSTAAGEPYEADRLPLEDLEFLADGNRLQFRVGESTWWCELDDYSCRPADENDRSSTESKTTEDVDSQRPRQRDGRPRGDRSESRSERSPDGRWIAEIRDGNVFVHPAEEADADSGQGDHSDDQLANEHDDAIQLSHDGTPEREYGMLQWAPDSQALLAFRIEPGEGQEVHLIESSPADGGRARLRSRPYALPGDRFTSYELNLFDVAACQQTKPELDRIDFGRPRIRWKADGRHFTYQQTDRGHQRFRVIQVDSHTGESRTIVDERSETFIWTAHAEHRGLPLVTWLERTDEVIYVSERDGWRLLYLIDGETGQQKHQITCGEFVVRGIDWIDEDHREIWFRASGRNPGQDPYFIHYYRVAFDGSGLVALTDGDGTHSVQYSPDRRYLIDTYSRVDRPPVHELRRTCDGALVCELEQADISPLEATGWQPPEVFVAKGRDGRTDIWGNIHRPRNLDPNKKYPIIEDIYAGPHSAYVPKAFSAAQRYRSLTDKGFIVVKIDGMGTAHRSKAFHDVCWHNLQDAGLPDRIAWIKAAAEVYPYMDVDRVGVYGTSAGGQSAAGALLFHPEFYKAAVASCGCHDNRMDKASWNEQWMGYPVGPQYAAASNIDNAHRLEGRLLLIVGELDTNVPPESTMRFVDALVKADKDFELLVLPGAGHTSGGAYGRRRLEDFFVRHLQATPGEDAPIAASDMDAGRETIELPDVAPARQRIARLAKRYEADRASLLRFHTVRQSPARHVRLYNFDRRWLAALEQLDSDEADSVFKGEIEQLQDEVRRHLNEIEFEAETQASVAHLVPFGRAIVTLAGGRQRLETIDARQAAGDLVEMTSKITDLHESLRQQSTGDGDATSWQSVRTWKLAAENTEQLRAALKQWFDRYNGYDPEFSWWMKQPYEAADKSLAEYSEFLSGQAQKTAASNDALLTAAADGGTADVPDLSALLNAPPQRMSAVIEHFRNELRDVQGNRRRRERREPTAEERRRTREFYTAWQDKLGNLEFDQLGPDDRADYLLLKNEIEYRLAKDELNAAGLGDLSPTPGDGSGLTGRPIGREGLLLELAHEMIPYTPEELIEIGRREYAWCEAELKRAAAEMGFGDDWHQAVQRVKNMHVDPGRQPALIRQLADEAVMFLKQHDMLTIPPLAEETWRMRMMSPERQLINPFFTGGEVISVSFPTDSMPHDAKLQSMRGNNIPFARATVHHELIPGHHLQGFMTARHRTHRRMFATPFWGEGWALYWEMVLYDRGLAATPEDRVGFLVWRAHRCARIIFSLSFHLGRMTPAECVDFLVARVGFERNNATAEVRRSIGAGYSPLYQAAYMLGGLQIRQLRRELVDTGKLTERELHDRILRENSLPIEMLRAILRQQPLSRDFASTWRFADQLPETAVAPAVN